MTVDELMQIKSEESKIRKNTGVNKIISIALKGIPLAMGAAVVVLSFMKQIDMASGLSMLGIGVFCLALERFCEKKEG